MLDDWVSLNVQQVFNARNERIQFYHIQNYKVGRNLLVNRFKIFIIKSTTHGLMPPMKLLKSNAKKKKKKALLLDTLL